MKLQHELGGLEGLGPIAFERRVFVEDWETRIFGIHVALMGLSASLRGALPRYDLDAAGSAMDSDWTWADLRKGAEAMNPIDYFSLRYYEKWLDGITQYCIEQGLVSSRELSERTVNPVSIESEAPDNARLDEQVLRYLREGDSPRRGKATPRFSVGSQVLVANPPRTEHTRLPGYLRGRRGVVERVAEGNYTYFCSTGPDGLGDPVPSYVVRFEHEELWGTQGETNPSPLYAELFEPYLTPAAPTHATPSKECTR